MKGLFANNISSTAQQGKGINTSKVLDVIGTKVANGDLVVLLLGDQYVDSFEGNDFVSHEVAIFDRDLCPLSQDLLAKSQHSFAHYGECGIVEMPRVGTKESAKKFLVPDMDMVNTSAGFRFKAESAGKDDKGNDLVNLKVERLQFFKVDGFKYYWAAVYDPATKNVVVVDEVDAAGNPTGAQYCKMKKVRKPHFVPAQLSKAQKAKVMKALVEGGLIAAEAEE